MSRLALQEFEEIAMAFAPSIEERLTAIYEDLMWLAGRPHVSPRQARAWYSQVLATAMASKVRRFTGMVSLQAISNINNKLVLEHYNRLSYSISRMIEYHLANNISAPSEFIKLVDVCERVNITTAEENQRVQRESGSYAAAEIQLTAWSTLSTQDQNFLWRTKLRGKVSNATDFAP